MGRCASLTPGLGNGLRANWAMQRHYGLLEGCQSGMTDKVSSSSPPEPLPMALSSLQCQYTLTTHWAQGLQLES